MQVRKLLLLVVLVLVLCPMIFAQGKSQLQPLTTDIQGVQKGVISVQTEGGWPITIRFMSNGELGLGTGLDWEQFPSRDHTGFLVYADPDECWSYAMSLRPDFDPIAADGSPMCSGVSDETYFRFTNEINLPNLAKDGKILGRFPGIYVWNNNTLLNDRLERFGPGLPDPAVKDNYGYGASPSIPGLVLLSDSGVGLVMNTSVSEPPSLASPFQQRNLAGFVNSVSWVASDGIAVSGAPYGRTNVVAHMNVPDSLFTPITLIDCTMVADEFGRKSCSDNSYSYQIDGGGIVSNVTQGDILNARASKLITLRVFVVAGIAPDVLRDMNGDGTINSTDAKLMGYKILSGDNTIQFRLIYQEPICNYYDFEKTGSKEFGCVAPSGSGSVKTVPR